MKCNLYKYFFLIYLVTLRYQSVIFEKHLLKNQQQKLEYIPYFMINKLIITLFSYVILGLFSCHIRSTSLVDNGDKTVSCEHQSCSFLGRDTLVAESQREIRNINFHIHKTT